MMMKKTLILLRKDLAELWSSKNLMVTFFLFSVLSWYYFAWMSYEFAMRSAQRGETRITIQNYWQFNADTSLIQEILSFNFFLLLIFLPYLFLSLLSEEKKQQWRKYFNSYKISDNQYLVGKVLLQVFLVILFLGSSVGLQYATVQSVIEEPLNFSYFGFTYLLVSVFLILILGLSTYSFYRMDSLLKGLVMTYVILIFFWLIHVPLENQGGILPAFFQELSFSYRLEKALEGLFRIGDVIYFGCLIVVINFAALKSLRKQQL